MQQHLRDLKRWSRKTCRQYLLRGLLWCGRCGQPFGLPAKAERDGRRYYYYACSSRRQPATRFGPKCGSSYLPAVAAEEQAWQACLAALRDADAFPARLQPAAPLAPDPEREALLAARDRLEAERERTLILFRRGHLTETEVDRDLGQLAAERRGVEERLAVIAPAAAPDPDTLRATFAGLLADLTANPDDWETRRRVVVGLLVRGVVIPPHVEWSWRR